MQYETQVSSQWYGKGLQKYKPSELVFFLYHDYDHGWLIAITPISYWKYKGCILDTHFRIEGLEHWGCGDMEGQWCVKNKRHRRRVARKLRSLGMLERTEDQFFRKVGA